VALVGMLREAGEPSRRLLDVQWSTPHLAGLGVVEMPRQEYLHRLRSALELPPPPAFG
jgi:leucyl/phenylalanyl-tRNA---protein transferase